MKRYRVRVVDETEQDLVDIYQYVASHDSVEAADRLLDELESLCAALGAMPQRAHIPPELERVAVTSYREVHFKPYRVIYEIRGGQIFVHCVLDGRRDLQSLLARRLLR